MAPKKTTAPRTDSKSSSSKQLQPKTEFRYYSPQAKSVNVAGTFNNWSPEMNSLKKGKDGNWTGQLDLAPGRYEYRFFVDGRWENDPNAPSVPNGFGSSNCVLEVK